MNLKDNLKLDNFLCFALYSASRSMTQLYKTYLDKHDLTYPQFLVLFLLWKQDGRSVSQLSNVLLLDSGTMTPLLKRMETKGLVRRARSASDERVVEVFLTETGQALESILAEVATGMLCDLQMVPEEVAALAGRLHAVRASIESATSQRAAGEGAASGSVGNEHAADEGV